MKCTGKQKRYYNKKRRRRRQKRARGCLTVILMLLCITAAGIYYTKKQDRKPDNLAAQYETEEYSKSIYKAEDSLYAEDLCAASEDVSMEAVGNPSGIHSAALFDINEREVEFSYKIHEKLYPASTTKILTALVAIKNGNLSDVITVSENAAASSFAPDEQVSGLEAGDQMSLEALLYGLVLNSGNDNAVAVAEHIAGSVEAFAEMMNEQAKELMATNSHFVNPSGLHDEEHYTTAYDLYLIFNECIKHQEFVDMISADSYTADITKADGSSDQMEVKPTNYYASGDTALPQKGGEVIGGKTGTTNEAGNCLILLDEDQNKNPYISIVMGADTKEILYYNMTSMIEAIPEN